MSLLLGMNIPERRGPARLGRPKVSEIPDERAKHIQCARLYYGTNWTVATIARHFDVARFTVYRWIDLAFTYDDPVIDQIRERYLKCTKRTKKPH